MNLHAEYPPAPIWWMGAGPVGAWYVINAALTESEHRLVWALIGRGWDLGEAILFATWDRATITEMVGS